MIRFVVICTVTRGKVSPAEPLDENGQALAYWRYVQDWSRDQMVTLESDLRANEGTREGFELSVRDCAVEWTQPYRRPTKKVCGSPARKLARVLTTEEAVRLAG